MTPLNATCNCYDIGCAHSKGEKKRCSDTATEQLYRIDMEDFSGTSFCDVCANDALESGLFTTDKNEADHE